MLKPRQISEQEVLIENPRAVEQETRLHLQSEDFNSFQQRGGRTFNRETFELFMEEYSNNLFCELAAAEFHTDSS